MMAENDIPTHTDALAKEIANQLKQNIPVQTIKEQATAKGATPQQIAAAMDEAHTLVQQHSDKDPWLRLLLGPALLLVSGLGFYTDWAGRFVGFGSVIGILCLLLGGRLVWSLLKQWLRK